jgi:hypothetical protein
MYKNVRVKVHVVLVTAVLAIFLLSPGQSPIFGGECPPEVGQTCGG